MKNQSMGKFYYALSKQLPLKIHPPPLKNPCNLYKHLDSMNRYRHIFGINPVEFMSWSAHMSFKKSLLKMDHPLCQPLTSSVIAHANLCLLMIHAQREGC